MTHAEAGEVLARLWKLPPMLATPIAHHHDPQAVEDPVLRKLTELARAGGRCADVFVDEEAAGAIARVRQSCGEVFALSEADADALLDDVGKRTREMASLFDINLGTPQDYEAILKKANEALVEITLQSQQQATQSEERAHSLKSAAATLAQQNQQLESGGHHRRPDRAGEPGPVRPVPGRAVRRRPTGGARGSRCRCCMLDVDKFKSVNDRFGHPGGDVVLKHLGRLLSAATRAQDLAARYGGEEMCLVLPGTARPTAAAIAESIRRAVAARPVPIAEGQTLPVSASIGVATFEPDGPLYAPAHLLKAADLAVYAAKRAGRNCVRVFAPAKQVTPATVRAA